MEIYRARENEKNYIKYEKSLVHNTALIAREQEEVVGVLEYEIKSMLDAEIINFKNFDPSHEDEILKGMTDEIMYWNPYVKRIFYDEAKDMITLETLENNSFIKNDKWVLHTDSDIEVFKIGIDKIAMEQLTVDMEKLDRAAAWIEKPEDIVVTCVKIDDMTVVIDGYSRLVAAMNKGFDHVYAHFEPDNTSLEFYKTCMRWCREEGVFTVEDLSARVVSPEEHQRLWINRCQEYLEKQRNEVV